MDPIQLKTNNNFFKFCSSLLGTPRFFKVYPEETPRYKGPPDIFIKVYPVGTPRYIYQGVPCKDPMNIFIKVYYVGTPR